MFFDNDGEIAFDKADNVKAAEASDKWGCE
jgi:hypothetical protein